MRTLTLAALTGAVVMACGSGAGPRAAHPAPAPAEASRPSTSPRSSGGVTPAVATPATTAPAPERTVHGLVVFGIATKLIAILPSARAPSPVQALAEVHVVAKPGAFDAALFAKPHALGYHTLEPEPFSAADLQKKGFRFSATLYAGNFERDDRVKIGTVTVEIARPILYREIPRTPAPRPTYTAFLFGSAEAGEVYLAHQIGARPTFAQIALVGRGADGSNPAWTGGAAVSAVGRADVPLARYDELTLQVSGQPRRVETRAVFTTELK